MELAVWPHVHGSRWLTRDPSGVHQTVPGVFPGHAEDIDRADDSGGHVTRVAAGKERHLAIRRVPGCRAEGRHLIDAGCLRLLALFPGPLLAFLPAFCLAEAPNVPASVVTSPTAPSPSTVRRRAVPADRVIVSNESVVMQDPPCTERGDTLH
jgi:hypothetical protein